MKKSDVDIIEEEYEQQRRVCAEALTKWSNLYDKVQWRKGTVRERIEAELLIVPAYIEKENANMKLDEIKEKFKAAIAREMAEKAMGVKNEQRDG